MTPHSCSIYFDVDIGHLDVGSNRRLEIRSCPALKCRREKGYLGKEHLLYYAAVV